MSNQLTLADVRQVIPSKIINHFCEECSYLKPIERKQKYGEKHYCHLYKHHLYHRGWHPHILRLVECKYEEK